MDHANLLETLENVVPEDMLLRIAPAISPNASPAADSLTSLRESAAARFQNENVSGSDDDDEKPEPLTQSPPIDSTRSPPGEQFSSDAQRSSLRPGSAAPSASSSWNSLHARGKRQSVFAGSSADRPHLQPPAARRSSMPLSSASVTQHSVALADGSQWNSPLSVTVSPVAQRHEPPLSSASRAANTLTPPSFAPVRSLIISPSDQQPAAAIAETNAHRVRFEGEQNVEVLDGSNKSPSGSGPKRHSWNAASDSRTATASNKVNATAPRSVAGSRRKSTM
jgi:hypothetical protein